jgi:hypothetical protein
VKNKRKPKRKAVPKQKAKPVGRPSKFNHAMCIQVEKLCKLGATDKNLADFFQVEESTINNWKIEFPEFLESIKNGKELADANVAERLYQRAMGFEHDSEEIKVVSNGMNSGSSIERVPIKKIYPPDTLAAIFWLKNRNPRAWRDKQEVDLSNSDGTLKPVHIIAATKETVEEINKLK